MWVWPRVKWWEYEVGQVTDGSCSYSSPFFPAEKGIPHPPDELHGRGKVKLTKTCPSAVTPPPPQKKAKLSTSYPTINPHTTSLSLYAKSKRTLASHLLWYSDVAVIKWWINESAKLAICAKLREITAPTENDTPFLTVHIASGLPITATPSLLRRTIP